MIGCTNLQAPTPVNNGNLHQKQLPPLPKGRGTKARCSAPGPQFQTARLSLMTSEIATTAKPCPQITSAVNLGGKGVRSQLTLKPVRRSTHLFPPGEPCDSKRPTAQKPLNQQPPNIPTTTTAHQPAQPADITNQSAVNTQDEWINDGFVLSIYFRVVINISRFLHLTFCLQCEYCGVRPSFGWSGREHENG